MKDKLQKTNRKKAYYRLRAFGIACLLTLGILALSSIPVIVSYTATISVSATSEKLVVELPISHRSGFQVLELK